MQREICSRVVHTPPLACLQWNQTGRCIPSWLDRTGFKNTAADTAATSMSQVHFHNQGSPWGKRLCGTSVTNNIAPKYLKDEEGAQWGVNFKLACVAETRRRNFSVAKSMGVLVNDLLGQNLVLICIITGAHKVGSRCSRGWGGDSFRKPRCANVLV